MGNILEDRLLSQDERALVRWLLEHGEPEAAHFLPQLEDARVASRCGCGCASVNFAVRGQTPSCVGGLDILSDYYWHDREGHALGVFVFACEQTLAGLEVYSMDGLSAADVLPLHEELIPVGTPTA
jgi:hypothetical protein